MAEPSGSAFSRRLYVATGWICVGLGLVGALVPLLPTTVFLLIAAWAFARSSPRWHRWLHEHPRFGGTIRAWEEHRAMPLRAKRVALGALAGSYLFTAWAFGPWSWTAIVGGICIALVTVYVAHIPVLEKQLAPSARP